MMKNLLSFLFVIAFLFGGALAVSAKTSSSPANSVAVSKRVSVANTKANSFNARCKVESGCGTDLAVLLLWNAIYEYQCPPPYEASCAPGTAQALINAGIAYETCLNSPFLSKNIDRKMDRNKIAKPRDVVSE